MWSFYLDEILLGIIGYLLIIICSILYRILRKAKSNKLFFIGSMAYLLIIILLFFNKYFAIYHNVERKNTITYSKKELVEDLSTLEKCIMKENPLYFANKNEVQRLFDEGYESIEDNMTEEEFYRLVNPIIVGVKCGHTNLSVSKSLVENRKESAKYIPMDIILNDNKLIVNESYKNIAKGDEIIEINKISSKDIILKLLDSVSHDGDNYEKSRYIVGRHFNNKYYDFIDSSGKYELKLIDSEGREYAVEVEGVYNEAYNTSAWNLHMADYINGNYYDYEIKDDEAILEVKVFFQEKQKFKDFLEEFFLEVNKNNINKLTIDLRGNFGGNPDMSKELLSYLVKEETEYFTENTNLPFIYKIQGLDDTIIPKENRFNGDVTVIIDGACFSTCGHFCAIVKENNLASIVGTSTGGGAACTDSSKNIELKNTGLRLHYSTKLYEVKANESLKNRVKAE